MTMDLSRDEFLRRYSEDLLGGNGAIFAGAGLSIPAGFVDWRSLLRDIATDLRLHVDEEADLIAVAQFEYNRKRSRDSLNQAILDRFARDGRASENHRFLARLPIDAYWTTNYDKVLEESLKAANRRVDVKYAIEQLAVHRRGADATVYKMHGDVEHPHHAVLTKDDYECYETERQAFITHLLSHLLTRRFLFLGFSFTDPNIEYTFNRLRRLLNPRLVKNETIREHFCFLRRPHPDDVDAAIASSGERSRRHNANVARFEHRVADLKRFGLQTLVLDDYLQITEILTALHRRVSSINVMVSGACDDDGPSAPGALRQCTELLGRRLIEEGYNIVSGMGKGIGAELLVGAHHALGHPDRGNLAARLRLFPFPYWHSDSEKRLAYFRANRTEMAAQAGAAIFISGNKRDGHGIVESPGVLAEFEEAKRNGHVIIPVGATGHAARRIWSEVCADPKVFFPRFDAASELKVLGDAAATSEQLVGAVLTILKAARQAS